MQINKGEEKNFKASKEAAEVSGKAFELKVKEDLGSYPSWLRVGNSHEIDNSADVIISMTQTESGLKLVREKVRADKDFKVVFEKLFERLSNLRDKISQDGNNLEDGEVLYIEDKDSWMNLDSEEDEKGHVTYSETIQNYNEATGETKEEVKVITEKENDRRWKIYNKEKDNEVKRKQEKVNILAKVLAENVVEVK